MATAAATLTTENNAATAAVGSGASSTQPTNGSAVPAAPGWWDSVKDSGTKDWLKAKNFPDADSALTSYRNLEQLFGADKAGRTVVLPKDDNDQDGWSSVAKRLGVPESPDGYKLPVPEGGDEAFSKTASSWFHEAGVPPRSASKIAEKWNSWVAEQVSQAEAADRAESEKQMQALSKEWGTNFDSQRELARRGYRQFAERFGLGDTAALERAESVLGAANLTRFFAGLGTLDSESAFAGNDGRGGFNTSPSEAQKEIDSIQAKRRAGEIDDRQWRSTYEKRVMELGRIVAKQLNQQ